MPVAGTVLLLNASNIAICLFVDLFIVVGCLGCRQIAMQPFANAVNLARIKVQSGKELIIRTQTSFT